MLWHLKELLEDKYCGCKKKRSLWFQKGQITASMKQNK